MKNINLTRNKHRNDRTFRLRKSSLAFDTIYAEGQRRYVESFQRMQDSFGVNG